MRHIVQRRAFRWQQPRYRSILEFLSVSSQFVLPSSPPVRRFYRGDSLGQLYRDRADAENAFDELKNQWGWGGFTTHDLHRCQMAARGVALAYNWWSLFVRLAHPDARREAITSRPWLMSSVGRRTEHAGQTTITLTGLHAHFEKARAALTRVSALLQHWVRQASEHLSPGTIWPRVCDHLKQTRAGIGPPPMLRLFSNHANGIG